MFRNIVLPKEGTINVLEQNAVREIPSAGYFKNMEVGAGNKTMKMDERGMWLGHAVFENAPFRVDMEGNFYLYSTENGGGFIKISADLTQILVNDGDNDRILIGRDEEGF